jgi:NADPH2:quinone reductase
MVRASVVHEFGPPEVLTTQEVADPRPGPGQLAIDVELASITFVETQLRAGKAPRPDMLPKLPIIFGNGVAGRIVEVGAGAGRSLLGKTVMSALNGSGGYASRAIAETGSVIEVPHELGIEKALALLADGRTAVLLSRSAAIQPQETVLVEAAAGGVGSLLVQLARSAGARVIGAVGGERKAAVAQSLGADLVVDYSRPNWIDEVPERVDVVFDGVGGSIGRAAFSLLRDGGRFCGFGMASGAFAPVTDVNGITVLRGMRATPTEIRVAAEEALTLALHGRLQPLIGQTFALEDAAAAHAAIESRATIGKTLLTV